MHFMCRKLIWINLFADLNWFFFLSSSPDLWYLLSLQQSVACLWVDSILNWGYKWLIAEIQTESLNLWPKILRFGELRRSKNRFGEGEVREYSQSPFLGLWGICQVLWEDVIYQARVIWSQQATVAGMKEVARTISLLRFIRNIPEVLIWSIKGQVREF